MATNVTLTGSEDTSGLITNFSPLSARRIKLDGVDYGVQNGNYSWSLANPDSYTLRFEVRSGDRWQHDPDWKERSEVSSGDQIFAYGETLSISYQFMIEPGQANKATGAIGTGNWLTLGQFHSDDGGSSSTFAVEMIGEKMAIRAAYKLPGQDYTAWYVFKDSQDIVRGKYYDMKIDVKFANDNTGYLNVWRDGVQIVDYDGPMGYGAGVYWKYGIYRHEQDETIAVNYRHMSVKSGDGVLIVGTPVADEITHSSSPKGQPTITDKGDTIVGGAGNDVVVAGKGNDIIIGSKGKDVLHGGGGNDVIKGGAGHDKLYGVTGNNKLKGGKGNDTITAGNGNDLLVGGRGKDKFVFTKDFGNNTIKGFCSGEDVIIFDKGLFANFGALKNAMSSYKGGVLIDTGDGSVYIQKVKYQKLDADDFLFA